ncbi:MAG: hypothetical protein AABY83_08120 [Pseudomonadota bacterium]|mgnify:CR=1 FL=1
MRIRLGVIVMAGVLAPWALHAEIPANDAASEVMLPGFQGILADQLPEHDGPGATLYQRYCSQCHRMVSPAKHSVSEWNAVLTRMRVKIKGTGKILPSDSDWAEILGYLQHHARK